MNLSNTHKIFVFGKNCLRPIVEFYDQKQIYTTVIAENLIRFIKNNLIAHNLSKKLQIYLILDALGSNKKNIFIQERSRKVHGIYFFVAELLKEIKELSMSALTEIEVVLIAKHEEPRAEWKISPVILGDEESFLNGVYAELSMNINIEILSGYYLEPENNPLVDDVLRWLSVIFMDRGAGVKILSSFEYKHYYLETFMNKLKIDKYATNVSLPGKEEEEEEEEEGGENQTWLINM